jgi:hypothetical protein
VTTGSNGTHVSEESLDYLEEMDAVEDRLRAERARPRSADPETQAVLAKLDGSALHRLVSMLRKRTITPAHHLALVRLLAEPSTVSMADHELLELARQASLPPAAPRWVRPLEDFLGDEEPDDDDSGDWDIRDVLPRCEPAILAGPPKSGKTWAALDLALSVATGTPWLGGAFENTRREPARVLVIALEDGQRRLRSRIWELARGRGITPNDATLREHLAVSREALRLPSKSDERAFVAELRAWRPAVVLVDNLTRVMVGDQNAIKDVALFTSLWARICGDVGAGVAFLHHTSKGGGEERDPFDMVRGSGDLVAAARNIVVTRPLNLEGEHLAEVRMRGNLDLRRDSFALGFERTQRSDGRWQARLVDRGDVEGLKAEVAGRRRDAKQAERTADRRQEAERRRDTALAIVDQVGHVSSRTLAEAIGVSARTAATVLSELAPADGSGPLTWCQNRGYVRAGGRS